MTLQQIKYFICVAEIGSISEAAKRLYVSQSSISSAIKEMERHYGVQLFQRGPRGIVLTGAGEELLPEFRVIEQKMNYLDSKYCEKRQQNVAFSVAAQHHVYALEPFLSVAKQMSAGQYKICFYECCTSEIFENVERGYADIGVFFSADPIMKQIIHEVDNHNLQFQKIRQEQVHVYIHKDHPLAKKSHIFLQDLMLYPCVTYDRTLRSNPLSGELIASCPQKIGTNDRAVAYSMLRNLNAFVTGSGDHMQEHYCNDILSIPIEDAYPIYLSWVVRDKYQPNEFAQQFLEQLSAVR